uniref:hypothetical protein n=1 Tax=Cupriavidus gilardii TaxID=82541 RepID=UPI002478FB87|nr:hypothetical protein [Cupriavidus gilardii]
MRKTHYFIVMSAATAAFTLVGCGKTETQTAVVGGQTHASEVEKYREIYRNDELSAQRDWSECKKMTGPLTPKCRMARQYGQQVYKAPEATFSSQGGSK